MKLTGKFSEAIIYTDELDPSSEEQIIKILNDESSEGTNIRIMPDVHAGAGCVIGYTGTITTKIIPNLIGVDIGCGMTAWNLKKVSDNFQKLDDIIRKHIPFGREVNNSFDINELREVYDSFYTTMPFDKWFLSLEETCKRTKQDKERVINSIGTLGGGNHFIEVDKNNEDSWLVIHSGSRNFGLKVALFHQDVADKARLKITKGNIDLEIKLIKKTKTGKDIETSIKNLKKELRFNEKNTGLDYIRSGDDLSAYLEDLKIAQIYAQLSRRVMGKRIIENMYSIKYFNPIESVHNYINFEDGIIRKGAISAHKGEKVIIPLNMADGIIIGIGKGNKDWNYSAPHGAGRKMSRSKAKKNISFDDYKEEMKDVWSSCVSESTLDEAPQAYKDAEYILKNIKDTVDISFHMKPVYNFKGE